MWRWRCRRRRTLGWPVPATSRAASTPGRRPRARWRIDRLIQRTTRSNGVIGHWAACRWPIVQWPTADGRPPSVQNLAQEQLGPLMVRVVEERLRRVGLDDL